MTCSLLSPHLPVHVHNVWLQLQSDRGCHHCPDTGVCCRVIRIYCSTTLGWTLLVRLLTGPCQPILAPTPIFRHRAAGGQGHNQYLVSSNIWINSLTHKYSEKQRWWEECWLLLLWKPFFVLQARASLSMIWSLMWPAPLLNWLEQRRARKPLWSSG